MFWTIPEARMVLSAWKTEKLIRYDSVTVNGDIDMFSRDFLSIVERAGQDVPQYTSQSMVNSSCLLNCTLLQTLENARARPLHTPAYVCLEDIIRREF
jgi:hypothetical protein